MIIILSEMLFLFFFVNVLKYRTGLVKPLQTSFVQSYQKVKCIASVIKGSLHVAIHVHFGKVRVGRKLLW